MAYIESDISLEYLKAMDFFEKGLYKQSFRLLKKGALKRHIECYANLAVSYDVGLGVKKNAKLALFWYKKAWKYDASSGICANIASLYAELGNIRQAQFWWNKAIDQFQDGDSALDFAKFLIRNHCPKNRKKIIELLNLAIKYEYTTEFSKREAKKILGLIMRNINLNLNHHEG